jgi:hypothetical protein
MERRDNRRIPINKCGRKEGNGESPLEQHGVT